MNYITEWLPFTFGQEYSFTLVVLLILALGGFREQSIPLVYRILAFSWLFASLQSKRSFGYFGVLAFPYFCYLFEPFTLKNPSKFNLSNSAKIGAIVALIIAALLHPLTKFKVDTFNKVPILAIDYLNHHCHRAHIFNDYNFGGYLALWLKDDVKYFIDGRAGTTFSEKFLVNYLKATVNDGNISKLISQNSVDAALISNDLKNKSTYALYFADWDLAYSDDYATIYFNNKAPGCKK